MSNFVVQDMELAGEFETHMTIAIEGSERIEALQAWSRNHGLKFLYIVLDRGVTASQPMLTRRGQGCLAGELSRAFALSKSLNTAGFSVARIKIEAAPWNQGIPQSNIEAQGHPADRYFEHHVKLLLAPSVNLVPLAELAERHSAHLSRNVLRMRSDNCHEQFVTQRCLGVGRAEARQRLQLLVSAIALLGHQAIDIEEEFVVYDSNLELDAGWICPLAKTD
jgi:hypothetical protein